MYRISLGERLRGLVDATTRTPIFTWPVTVSRPSADIVWRSAAIRYADQASTAHTCTAPLPESAATEDDGEVVAANDSGRRVRPQPAANDGGPHARQEVA